MIDLAAYSPAVQAGALVGAVLLEAFVLYVAYGDSSESQCQSSKKSNTHRWSYSESH